MLCLLLSQIASALFLTGQAEQGSVVSILCEGQSSVFLSLPTGELRELPLDSDFQAEFLPASSGPHTVQCGNETRTISVLLPAHADPGAYSSGENLALAAGAAIIFLAALCLAARLFLKPCTIFSKSGCNGRVRLYLHAGEDLQGIKIFDPQGGEGGQPLELSIPHLPSGAEWIWEYDANPGWPLLSARLSAKGAKGEISLLSGSGSGMPAKAAEKSREARKLPKHAD